MDDRHADAGFAVVVESLRSEPGLEVIDPIERRRRPIRTPAPVSPTPVDVDAFPFPVETAVRVETAAVSLQTAEHVLVRDAEGQMIAEVSHGEQRSFPAGSYTIEPSGVVKLYFCVDGPVTVAPDGHGTTIEFGGVTTVDVGCRSAHERPAATVTTTADPADVLDAISTFGSALKTTSPERSFSSFRGHPPALELGDELDVPDGLVAPEADLHLEVPAAYRYAFPVAPLAYYLGVPVRQGPTPRLCGDGVDHEIGIGGSFEVGVQRLLQRVFLLECATRTEGLYRIDLYERERLDEHVDLDYAALYDAPQAERLAAYLDVPFDAVEAVLPDWQTAAHVEPTAATIESLPFLVDDLALVHIADPDPVASSVIETGGVEAMSRGGTSSEAESSPSDAESPSSEAASPSSEATSPPSEAASPSADEEPLTRGVAADQSFVDIGDASNALEETWIGEGTPVGPTKAVSEAYENRIGRSASTGSIDITVVCNADAMAEEQDLVDEVYGSRSALPFDVTVRRDLTTDELADLLAEPRDFLHYVGHIDGDGFECADGHLDVATLEAVGVDAFFLNACQSYEQGMELIRKGAIGGIVTISDVVNFGAVQIGRAVARLLNSGFPLRSALEIAREESVIGSLYIVVGDGGLSIVQTESGTPMLLRVDSAGEQYQVSMELYGVETGLGGVYYPHLEANDRYYLGSGETEPITVDPEDLADFLDLEPFPVRTGGRLCWSDELTISDL